MRGQHLEVDRPRDVTVLTAKGAGKSVAEIRMEDELSVIKFGSGVVHPTVRAEHVVTCGEHQDHLARVCAGQTGHVSNVACEQIQGHSVVSITTTGSVSHVTTPEVELSPGWPLTRLTVSFYPLRTEDVLPGAGVLVKNTGAASAFSAPQPQLSGGQAVILMTPTVEHGEAGL